MSQSADLRALVTQRLTAAAEDIFLLFEKTIAEYQREVLLLTHNNSQQQRPGSQQHQPNAVCPPDVHPLRQDSAPIPAAPQLQEPEEFSFDIVIVGAEDDKDENPAPPSQALGEKTQATDEWTGGAEAGCSSEPITQLHSDTDSPELSHPSEHYSRRLQAHRFKRSFTMIPADSLLKQRRFRCSVCGRGFARNSDLKRHMIVHTGEKPYKCPECERYFALKSNLVQHLKVVHGIICTEEDKKYLLKPVKPFVCSECGDVFKLESNFNEHMKSHMEQKPFECPVCADQIRDQAAFSEHLRTHADEGTVDPNSSLFAELEKPYGCHKCGKRFQNRPMLTRHRLSHTEERPHRCSVCGTGFKHKFHLTQHLVLCQKRYTNNGEVGEKPYVCQVCGKRFLHKCSLGNHMRIHAGDTPLVCPVCGEGFNTKKELLFHQRLAHQLCGLCKVLFPDMEELKAHMETHVEEEAEAEVEVDAL